MWYFMYQECTWDYTLPQAEMTRTYKKEVIEKGTEPAEGA